MLTPNRRARLAMFAAAVLVTALGPLSTASAASDQSRGYLPFPSGSSTYVAQGNCLNGSTGIPNPTHCDQFGRYAWDFVYARGGRPISSEGMTVDAAVSGTVVYSFDAGRGDALPSDCLTSGSGNFVIVDDGDGTYTQYLHLADGTVAVQAGDPLLLGDRVGAIGSSGESTGAHLHFSWVTAVDHCGVGVSTPGSFVDTSAPVPVFGDVNTSGNPGALSGRIVTDGTNTYVVAGGAPLLVADCVGLYGQTVCDQPLLVPSLAGLAQHPVSGTDLLAQPSGLAYRVVGGAAIPIPDCASFSTCSQDTITVPDAAISAPDARLASMPAQWTLMKTGTGNTVWEFAEGCFRSSTIWFDASVATLVPSTALSLWPTCPLPNPTVSIKKGSPGSSDIFFSLWDPDGSTYDLASSTTSPQASAIVSFDGAPKSIRALTVSVATTATRSCSQTLALWNWKSNGWDTVDTTAVSSALVQRMGAGGKASPAAYVSGSSGNGTIRLRLSCERGKGRFDYAIDWAQVRFTS